MKQDGTPTPPKSNPDDWREIAAKASAEHDPQKLSDLVQQLCDRLDEMDPQKKKPAQSETPKLDRQERL